MKGLEFYFSSSQKQLKLRSKSSLAAFGVSVCLSTVDVLISGYYLKRTLGGSIWQENAPSSWCSLFHYFWLGNISPGRPPHLTLRWSRTAAEECSSPSIFIHTTPIPWSPLCSCLWTVQVFLCLNAESINMWGTERGSWWSSGRTDDLQLRYVIYSQFDFWSPLFSRSCWRFSFIHFMFSEEFWNFKVHLGEKS